MARNCEVTLEFNKIKAAIASFTHSTLAKSLIHNISPQYSFDGAKNLLAETNEADKLLYTHCVAPSLAIDDVSESVKNAQKYSILSMGEILKIARLLRISRNLRQTIDLVNDSDIVFIKRYCGGIFCDDALEKEIDKAILNDNEMSDNASIKLASIRKSIKRINDKIKEKLASFVSSSTYQRFLQDNIVTMRNNRYVLPVKSEYRSQIQGLVHDQSSSGATVYVEPFVIVELNNELKTLTLDEQLEIEAILRDFTLRISDISDFILSNIEIVAKLDVIFSKAKYAKENKSVLPILNDKGYINIIKGRHPLIEKEKVVPVSVALGNKFNILLITGPNTGGKTVSLKLVGLFSLMAMSGIFLPCEEGSEVSVFDGVFCDIGDEQSIEQSLSTFSSHITNIKNICDAVTEKSLVLLDEIGAGTDPSEGSALAISVVEFLLRSNTNAIVTTHYNELKEFSFRMDGIENASMGFNPSTFAPTYQLLVGIAGSSNALEIADRLGLNEEIVRRARSLISKEKENFEEVLKSAEQSRRKTEELNKEIDELKTLTRKTLLDAERDRNFIKLQREKLEANMQKEAKVLLEDYMEEATELLDKIKETLDTPTDNGLFEARRLKKKLENLNYTKDDTDTNTYLNTEIKLNDSVFIQSLGVEGKVVSINNKREEYTINLGIANSVVKFGEVKKIKSKGDKGAGLRNVSVSQRHLTKSVKNIKTELNIIGKRVEEALLEVEAFLDDIALSGLSEVRIVHGKGTGVLRKAVQDFVKGHYAVESFRNGKYGEGEMGVTIVCLKKQ